MKKIFIPAMIVITLSAASYYFLSILPAQEFAKKEACATHKSDIETELSKIEGYRADLEEIFYSPSLNSCLYSYVGTYINNDGSMDENLTKTLGIDLVIKDALTGKLIFSAMGILDKNARAELEDKKRELKK